MTKEEKLKLYILSKYRSVREFTQKIDMPYSTISTIFRRGIDSSNVLNIIKICQALEISADDLADGKITPINKNSNDSVNFEELINEVKQIFLNADQIMIDGIQATSEDVHILIETFTGAMDLYKKQFGLLHAYSTKPSGDDQ